MKTLKNNSTLKVIISLAFLVIGQLMLTNHATAQNVGVNNPTPHAKALIDLTATDKGMLAPRLTAVQKNAMFPAPDITAKGMLIYQTDGTQGFYYYDGVSWNGISKDSQGWSTIGNAGTDSLINFLGTTDNKPLVIKTNNAE